MNNHADRVRAAAREITSGFKERHASEETVRTITAIISRHITESDLYRAGVAACVAKVKAARDEWNSLIANDEDRWHKGGHCAAEELVTALESLADSAASPAAQPPYRLFSEVEIHEAIDKATEVFSGVLNELQRDQISVDTVKNLRSPAAQQQEVNDG